MKVDIKTDLCNLDGNSSKKKKFVTSDTGYHIQKYRRLTIGELCSLITKRKTVLLSSFSFLLVTEDFKISVFVQRRLEVLADKLFIPISELDFSSTNPFLNPIKYEVDNKSPKKD